jgi:ATP-dependent DNA helicase RecQ
MKTPLQILQYYWKHPSFRGEQEQIIEALLENNNVLALLPTGSGKSICFQIPALLKQGLCLVISPLIALMKDQVENLNQKNIPSAAIYSGMSTYELNTTLAKATNGNIKFLYVSPERLTTNLFQQFLNQAKIGMVAVDEAHCISQWGYDFRPAYLKISLIKKQLPSVPFIALTATATTIVKQDIIDKLQLKNVTCFSQSFEKPNVSFSVFKVDNKLNKALEILNKVKGSSIIYCKNRNETKTFAKLLVQNNIDADFYHAGLTQEQRNQKQNNWVSNKTRVLVCTNAFGMGIDKPDVKSVIHFTIPDCIENYYQEAGRAGRNGTKAYAVLLFQSNDEVELNLLPEIRFPTVEEIKNIYQQIANYLQIPIGIGENNYYNFDIIEFCNKFKLNAIKVINTLKYLEQEGHLAFSENIFLPSKVTFTTNKATINRVEIQYPELDLVMKTLLRTYEGIYENVVSINEKLLAKISRLTYERVYSNLKELHLLGIIKYIPQKETPQLYFMVNRASANEVLINFTTYLNRKKLFKQKVDVILKYVHLVNECRSKFLANYFGDSQVKSCKICDNCLAQNKLKITDKEFSEIQQLVLNALADKQISIKNLLQALKPYNKEKIVQVLSYLQSEKIIKADNLGNVSLIKL